MLNLPRIAACFLMIMSGAAFAVEPEIVVNIEKIGEAFVVEATIDVQAPLRMAWEVLTDFDNMAGILSNLTSSKIIRRKDNIVFVLQEGSARYGIFSYSFASEREIRMEPMKRILARQIAGNAKRFESELELTQKGQRTLLRYHAEIVPDSGIARTFGGPFIQHEVEEQFTAMAAEMMRRKTP
ncbi:SRPBCC family protein [Propionivibrio sp.]|uniref:SRPBCC family protein n=1 Tax=Propionivibrio sp. TaxID=2212460 RepID=UPI003BF09CF2